MIWVCGVLRVSVWFGILACCDLGMTFCGWVVAFDLIVAAGLVSDVIAWVNACRGLGLDFGGGFPVV